MKARESGMPGEAYWASFFDADALLECFWGSDGIIGDVLEFGCGYGTFTLPAARRTTGIVTALDIDPEMVACVRKKIDRQGLSNIHSVIRDFVSEGSGLTDKTQAHAMIFNLLHIENPIALLREAHRTLTEDGTLSVMHWRRDIKTPRGPSLAIRPSPTQCMDWMKLAGFREITAIDLQAYAPYHFGLAARC